MSLFSIADSPNRFPGLCGTAFAGLSSLTSFRQCSSIFPIPLVAHTIKDLLEGEIEHLYCGKTAYQGHSEDGQGFK